MHLPLASYPGCLYLLLPIRLLVSSGCSQTNLQTSRTLNKYTLALRYVTCGMIYTHVLKTFVTLSCGKSRIQCWAMYEYSLYLYDSVQCWRGNLTNIDIVRNWFDVRCCSTTSINWCFTTHLQTSRKKSTRALQHVDYTNKSMYIFMILKDWAAEILWSTDASAHRRSILEIPRKRHCATYSHY